MIIAAILSCFALCGWIYLAFFRAGFWQLALDGDAPEPEKWPSIDIVVPARNEADILPRTLTSLLAQDYPGAWRVLLVDDHSTDGTGAVAQRIAISHKAIESLTVIEAPD